MPKKIQRSAAVLSNQPLRVGFVPLVDCAPLVMAHELGLFHKHGLRVKLQRELGWATIRDKVIYGELEAAHAVAGMPFAATLGLGSMACDCLTALILNQHGNAISLSNDLVKRGVRDGASLRVEVLNRGRDQKLIFGTVHPFSSHTFLLREWLSSAGVDPDRDVRIVVVPPPQMVSNLKAGHLDGFCVGEPWNSVAAISGLGWSVATSAELAPGHPEKILMTRRDFAMKCHAQHLQLVACLLEACAFCQVAENHNRVAATLSRSEFLGVPEKILAHSLGGHLEFGRGHALQVRDFNIFHSADANEPSAEKAGWVLRQLRASGAAGDNALLTAALGRRVFRTDLFRGALQILGWVTDSPYETNELQSELQVVTE